MKSIYLPSKCCLSDKREKEEILMKGLRTKKVNTIKEGTLIVAVDIGMVSNHGCCTTADGRSTKTFSFDNTREGLDILWNMVLASKTRFQCNEVIIGYESTGPYGEPLIHYLKQKAVTIVQVNPLHTKRMREINDNSPLKTDRKDPRVIADVIRIGHALSVVVPEGDAAYLRRLNNARERHTKERTALLNQLQQFVFLIFPEFTRIIKTIYSKTALHILKKYTTPAKVCGVKIEKLGEEMWRRSKGKFGVEHATALINFAKTTIGIQEGLDGLVMDIQHALVQLEMVDSLIAELEHEMETTLQRIPYSRKLLSIKGFGIVTVAGLIGEIGDFTKFTTQSEIAKLAGLDLYEVSSGKRRGQRRISKRGRSLLRKILYYAAMQTIRKNGIMHDYYQRLIGRGMKSIMALVAVSRKLLRIIFAIVRDDTEFI
ncbi:MAG: IS110 family transposase, partial [Chitinophagaceae bacterium]